jgi:hypothetical protein
MHAIVRKQWFKATLWRIDIIWVRIHKQNFFYLIKSKSWFFSVIIFLFKLKVISNQKYF